EVAQQACRVAIPFVQREPGNLWGLRLEACTTILLRSLCKTGPALLASRLKSLASSEASHSLTSVVFPNPAGAEMTVSLRRRLAYSRAVRRGRRKTFGRDGGNTVS